MTRRSYRSKMTSWRYSSTWKFFLYAFFGFILVSLVVTGILGFFLYRHESGNLERNLEQVKEVYLPFLIPALWVTDYGALQSQIEGIVKFRYIKRVEVRNDEGEVFSAGTASDPSLEVVSQELFYDNRGQLRNIGSISLFLDRNELLAQIVKWVKLMLLIQFLLSLVLSLVIAGVYHLVIGGQLFRLARFVKTDDLTDLQEVFRLQRPSQKSDELQLLVDRINEMRGMIGRHISEIQGWRDLLQHVIQHDPNAIMVLDKDLRFVFVSEKMLENNGIQGIEVIGRTLGDVFPYLDAKWIEIHKRALCGEILGSEDDFILREDGRFDNIRWKCRPWYKSGGQIEGTIFYSEIITERKQMERSLFLEKELFRTTLLSVGDGVISTDNEGRVLIMNRVAEDLTGWNVEDAKGKEFRQVFNIIDELSRGKAPDPIRQVLDSGEPVELEENCILISREGRETPIEDSAAPIRDKEGETTGVVIVFRDCSEKRERQKEIEYLSYHDQLTGLYNRRFFEEELRRLDVPRNLPLSLVMIDVNGLKLFNDAFGHNAGDELLEKVAEVLRKVCRADDIAARIGGDEFMILLPLTDRDHLDPLMARISDAMSKERVKDLPVSVSLGGATKTDAGESVEKVFDMAEDQMYRRKISEKSSYHNRSVKLILETLYSKSPWEKEHSENVSVLSGAIGLGMGLAQPEIDDLKAAGIIHDIGKIAVSNNILEKDGPLDEEEWEEIRKHPETGYSILSTVNEYSPFAKIVLYHHERWDGKGYPNGLKGYEIPLQSRILGVADAYDAMVSERAYRKAMSREDALAELRRCAGTQFDPEVVKIFSGIVPSLERGGSSEILKEDLS